MADNFSAFQRNISGPATKHYAITPSNDADLNPVPRSIFCSVAGSAVLRDAAGSDVTYQLVAGQVLPFRAHRVLATGTTATLIGWE